jgi:hypothetical protein
MKRLLIIGFTLSFLFAEHKHWSSHSAYVLPEKRIEIGLFQPLRMGVSGRKEWAIHPVYFFVMPNVSLKKSLPAKYGFAVASRHSIIYPTPLLNILARKGTGGLISSEFTFPAMGLFNNEILLTRKLKAFNITMKAGFVIGISPEPLAKESTLDLPIVYHRLAPLYNGWGLRTGIDLGGRLANRIQFLADLDLHITPKQMDLFAIEHKGMLIWEKSERLRISLGYKLVYGKYPFGTAIHLLPYLPMLETWVPFLDMEWAWDR